MTAKEVHDSVRSGGLSNLAAELGTPLSKAAALWREIQQQLLQDNNSKTKPQTAQQILLAQQSNNGNNKTSSLPVRKHILTFSRNVDDMLDGGIALGELTELVGPPGTGKTQWGMQLAVDTALPPWAGGVDGETCYLDTEGSFCPERCHTMARALVDHVKTALQRRMERGCFDSENNKMRSPEEILRGVHVIRIHDQPALQATLEGRLPQLVQERKDAGSPIRLVVIDSIAFPIRSEPPPTVLSESIHGNNSKNNDMDFYVARNRQLTVFAMQLSQLAANYGMAVLAVNQMTTKISNGASQLVPALGESWAHAVTTRLLLSSNGGRRTCALVKSPRLPTGSADYQILECGVRNLDPQLLPNGRAKGTKKRRRDGE